MKVHWNVENTHSFVVEKLRMHRPVEVIEEFPIFVLNETDEHLNWLVQGLFWSVAYSWICTQAIESFEEEWARIERMGSFNSYLMRWIGMAVWDYLSDDSFIVLETEAFLRFNLKYAKDDLATIVRDSKTCEQIYQQLQTAMYGFTNEALEAAGMESGALTDLHLAHENGKWRLYLHGGKRVREEDFEVWTGVTIYLRDYEEPAYEALNALLWLPLILETMPPVYVYQATSELQDRLRTIEGITFRFKTDSLRIEGRPNLRLWKGDE